MRHTKKARKPPLKMLSVKLPVALSARIAQLARARRTTTSEVVRNALERYEEPLRGSFFDLATDYIGALKGGPGDLATNPKHLEGFGG